ncbi:hypothetical protein CW751_06220 [Brumimicrobium salinarum]|uniref:Uncharacterized protein n=1 Tax=Brumimicrobium salinarum TaxID=2058658 RepID=A0A2I0R3M2_9FLAO|nr:hypothetical protein CW751_06220 [Brumimicrobium salinarum]
MVLKQYFCFKSVLDELEYYFRNYKIINNINMNFKSGLLTIISVLLIGSSVLSQKNDPVVLTVNDESITKSEFLQVYLKNNDDPQYDKESLDEYVELYKKFKLKVAEAEALGYDTIPALVRELNGYKEQLAKPYLTDKSKSQALIDEAYQRMQSEIKASHILINLKPNAAPEDTLKAYNRAMQLRKRIINGEDFAEVAKGKDGSEDPSVKKMAVT